MTIAQPRVDLPAVGDKIAALSPHGWYYGPLKVVAVEADRPRVTLSRTDVTTSGGKLETEEVHDGARTLSDGPPYSHLRWKPWKELTKAERAPIIERKRLAGRRARMHSE